MTRTILALLLALSLLDVAGGVSGAGPVSGEPIRLWAISSLTGSFATFGSMERAGYALAASDINTAGGINGRPLVIADRAYVMESGRIVLTGGGSELLQSAEVKRAYLGI